MRSASAAYAGAADRLRHVPRAEANARAERETMRPPYPDWPLHRRPIWRLSGPMTALTVPKPLSGPRAVWTRRIIQLLGGLFFYGIGIALMVRAGIGVPPWDVLTQGISLRTGLPF